MEDLFSRLIGLAFDKCSIATGLSILALIYQTIQLGKLRGEVERDRRQIVTDAEARTRTAEAVAEAQQEMVLRLIQRRSGTRAEG